MSLSAIAARRPPATIPARSIRNREPVRKFLPRFRLVEGDYQAGSIHLGAHLPGGPVPRLLSVRGQERLSANSQLVERRALKASEWFGRNIQHFEWVARRLPSFDLFDASLPLGRWRVHSVANGSFLSVLFPSRFDVFAKIKSKLSFIPQTMSSIAAIQSNPKGLLRCGQKLIRCGQ